MPANDDADGFDATCYSFKPSLAGAPCEFSLDASSIEMRSGNRAAKIAYRDVRYVRMTFRPVTMLHYRFVTELWASSGTKLTIASASWRSMVEYMRLDASYNAFVAELHRRIAASGASATYRAGSPAFLYWPGVVIFTGLMVATVVLAFRAVQLGEWRGAALVAAMFGFFLWQAGSFFRRNLPAIYRPDRLPPQVLP